MLIPYIASWEAIIREVLPPNDAILSCDNIDDFNTYGDIE